MRNRRPALIGLAVLATVLEVYLSSYFAVRHAYAATVELPLPFVDFKSKMTVLVFESDVAYYLYWPVWKIDGFVSGLHVASDSDLKNARPY
jgi:hypothetical protein